MFPPGTGKQRGDTTPFMEAPRLKSRVLITARREEGKHPRAHRKRCFKGGLTPGRSGAQEIGNQTQIWRRASQSSSNTLKFKRLGGWKTLKNPPLRKNWGKIGRPPPSYGENSGGNKPPLLKEQC